MTKEEAPREVSLSEGLGVWLRSAQLLHMRPYKNT